MYFNLNENNTRTVEQNWNFFHENILSIVDKNIPAKNITASNRLPWMTSELKRMIKRKQRLYNRANRFNRPSDWKLYKDMQSRVRITLKQLRLKYLTESLKPDDDNNRRKTFWRFIKTQKQDTTEISSLQLPTGQVTAPKEIAEVLNNQFKSVFTKEDLDAMPETSVSSSPPINDIVVCPNGVFKLLSELNPFKSPGPDAVSGHVLKQAAAEVTPMLTHLFQQSLSAGEVPKQWKLAYVTPIFKAGKRSNPTNYRPISLTSIVCKAMEHILTSEIMKYLEAHNILAPCQFGFRSAHSCESQLLTVTDDLSKALNNKLQVDVGILDLSKAFDKVPHRRLLSKIESYGITGKVLNWLESFLSNRSQQVIVNGSFSSPCDVISGVPQGSVLGPTLFLLYINDITEGINSQMKLFADDCLIYRVIHNTEDHQALQRDLTTLSKWADKWQMAFNISKCKIMQVSNHHSKSLFTYEMSGIPLAVTEQHLYLGVKLHHKLSWKPHIDYICSKANKTIGFLKRNLHHCPKHLRELAYKQFVIPVLEYCSPIWDPYHQSYIDQLEMVQHGAARFVTGIPWRRDQRDSITDILRALNWPTLQKRRQQARLVLLFKILKDFLTVPSSNLPTKSSVLRTRYTHNFKLTPYQPNIDLYKFSFLPRTVPEWNRLDDEVIQSNCVETFKQKLVNIM